MYNYVRPCERIASSPWGTNPVWQRLEHVMAELLSARTYRPDEADKLKYLPSRSPEDRLGAEQIYEVDVPTDGEYDSGAAPLGRRSGHEAEGGPS
jgi:hypothetical protein